MSASNSSDVLSTVWTVPYQHHPFFTGQEALLTKLGERLQSSQVAGLTQPPAVASLGGIGKTQIAVEYAWRHRSDYQYVLWSRADTREVLISGYVALVGYLNLPEKEEKDQTVIVGAIKHWLVTHTRWLLILDNADDLSLIGEFLPLEHQMGHLLLTTRRTATDTLAHSLEVRGMPPDMGATLLLRRARRIAPNASLDTAELTDITIAQAISKDLGGLPLALDQAGAYIEETRCSLADYQAAYRLQPSAVLKQRRSLAHGYPEPVATIWSLAFERVKQQNPAAASLLRCCAFLQPDAIPEELITSGAECLGTELQQIERNPLAFNEALSVLLSYSLIRRDPAAATFSIHQLVQMVLQDQIEAAEKKIWAERIVKAVHQIFSSNMEDPRIWKQCERLLPQARTCEDIVRQYSLTCSEGRSLLARTGRYFQERGRLQEALTLYKQTLEMTELQCGMHHIDTAQVLNNLGMLYVSLAEHQLAEPLLVSSIEIFTEVCGRTDPQTLAAVHYLGMLYYHWGLNEEAQGKTKEAVVGHMARAERLLRAALIGYEQNFGKMHPALIPILGSLGVLYVTFVQHELKEYFMRAGGYLKRAYALAKNTLGKNDPTTIGCAMNLATFYVDQEGQFDKAEELYQNIRPFYEVLGLSHPTTIGYFNNLAECYGKQGKNEQAEACYQCALAASKQAFGSEHSLTLTIQKNYLRFKERT